MWKLNMKLQSAVISFRIESYNFISMISLEDYKKATKYVQKITELLKNDASGCLFINSKSVSTCFSCFQRWFVDTTFSFSYNCSSKLLWVGRNPEFSEFIS